MSCFAPVYGALRLTCLRILFAGHVPSSFLSAGRPLNSDSFCYTADRLFYKTALAKESGAIS